MKQTETGLIPEDWDTIKFEEFCVLRRGRDLRKEDFRNGEIPVAGSNGVIGFHNEANYKGPGVTVGRSGSCGSVHYYETDFWAHNTSLSVCDFKTNNPRFVYWKLLSLDLRRYASGVSVPTLNRNAFNNILLYVPPLPEQQSISHILTLIQSAIQKQEQIIRTTTELKNALLQRLFTEGTKGEAQKKTEIGLIPESWEVVELRRTGDVIYGIQAAVANNTTPIGTKILTNVNISLDGRIDLQKVRYYKLKSKRDFNTTLQQGDILFNWRSGSKEHVGKTAIFDLEGEYTHSSFILRIRPNDKVVNHYLYFYLNHLRATGYFVKQQTYSINAKFNKSAIEVLPVALPDKDEQLIISNTIKTIDTKLQHHQSKKQTLTALFRSMLHQLMTGQISVKDLELKKV